MSTRGGVCARHMLHTTRAIKRAIKWLSTLLREYTNQKYHVYFYTWYFLSFFLCGAIFYVIFLQLTWRA